MKMEFSSSVGSYSDPMVCYLIRNKVRLCHRGRCTWAPCCGKNFWLCTDLGWTLPQTPQGVFPLRLQLQHQVAGSGNTCSPPALVCPHLRLNKATPTISISHFLFGQNLDSLETMEMTQRTHALRLRDPGSTLAYCTHSPPNTTKIFQTNYLLISAFLRY